MMDDDYKLVQIDPPTQQLRSVQTYLPSVLFYDRQNGKLRHGGPDLLVTNVFLAMDDQGARLVYVDESGRAFAIGFRPKQGGAIKKSQDSADLHATSFELVKVNGGTSQRFGLKSHGLFLTSELDSTITLSRSLLGPWELFQCVATEDAAAEKPRRSDKASLVKYPWQLPVRFFSEGKIGFDSSGIPFVSGTLRDIFFASPIVDGSEGELTLVMRDPTYIHHYYHFLETFLVLFAAHMEFCPTYRAVRVIFGEQDWNNPRQNEVQKHLLTAAYGNIKIHDELTPIPDGTVFQNVLVVDRNLPLANQYNIFPMPVLPLVRAWMPEFRSRIYRAARVEPSSLPRNPNEVQCTYIHRGPPRRLVEPLKDRLLDLLNVRFGAAEEIDFAKVTWAGQVAHSARRDVLIGVHGNGLTNLLWLPAHAFVIEIFPPGFHSYCYQVMSEICRLTYFGIEGDPRGLVYRDGNRLAGPHGNIRGNRDIHRSVEQLPEIDVSNIMDLIAARFSDRDGVAAALHAG